MSDDILAGDTIFYRTKNDVVTGYVVSIRTNQISCKKVYKVLTRKLAANNGTTTRQFFRAEIEKTTQKNVDQMVKELAAL